MADTNNSTQTQTAQPYNIFKKVQLPNLQVNGTNQMQQPNLLQTQQPNPNVNVNVPITPQPTEGDGTQPQERFHNNPTPYESRGKAQAPIQPAPVTQTPTGNVQPIPDGKPRRRQGANPDGGNYLAYNDLIPQKQGPVVNNPAPDDYVSRLNQVKQQQAEADAEKAKQVPSSKEGGKGLTGWITRNLKGDGTKEGNRKAVQNITAATQMLRHAWNLWGVTNHAYNQQIDDQFSKNEAGFKEKDAEEAARQAAADKAQREREKAAQDQANKDREYNFNYYKWYDDAKRANAKEARDKDKYDYDVKQRPLDEEKKKGEARTATAKAVEAEAKAKLTPELMKSTIGKNNAAAGASRASGRASDARAGYYNSKTRGQNQTNAQNADKPIGGPNVGSFTGSKSVNGQQNRVIVERLRALKLVSDDVWDRYNAAKSDSGERQLIAKDIIAKAVAYTPKQHASEVSNILTSNGYTRAKKQYY